MNSGAGAMPNRAASFALVALLLTTRQFGLRDRNFVEVETRQFGIDPFREIAPIERDPTAQQVYIFFHD